MQQAEKNMDTETWLVVQGDPEVVLEGLRGFRMQGVLTLS